MNFYFTIIGNHIHTKLLKHNSYSSIFSVYVAIFDEVWFSKAAQPGWHEELFRPQKRAHAKTSCKSDGTTLFPISRPQVGYPCLHWHFAIIKKSNFVNHHHSHRAQWLTQSPVRIGGTVRDGCARVGWNRSASVPQSSKSSTWSEGAGRTEYHFHPQVAWSA